MWGRLAQNARTCALTSTAGLPCDRNSASAGRGGLHPGLREVYTDREAGRGRGRGGFAAAAICGAVRLRPEGECGLRESAFAAPQAHVTSALRIQRLVEVTVEHARTRTVPHRALET